MPLPWRWAIPLALILYMLAAMFGLAAGPASMRDIAFIVQPIFKQKALQTLPAQSMFRYQLDHSGASSETMLRRHSTNTPAVPAIDNSVATLATMTGLATVGLLGMAFILWGARHLKQGFPTLLGEKAPSSLAMLSVSSTTNLDEGQRGYTADGVVKKVQAALTAGSSPETAKQGHVLCVESRTEVLGMVGTSVLTWDSRGASVHRGVDCTAALHPEAQPVCYATAISMQGSTAAQGDAESTQQVAQDDENLRLIEESSVLSRLNPKAVCWERDWSGLTSELELDDAESTALGHWLCTGQWLQLISAGVLQVEMMDATLCQQTVSQLRRLADNKSAIALDHAAHSYIGLQLHITGGAICARVLIDQTSWLPIAALMEVAGGTEVWIWQDWTQCASQMLPGRAVFIAPSCTPVVYDLSSDTLQVMPSRETPPWLLLPSPLTGSLLDPCSYSPAERYLDPRYSGRNPSSRQKPFLNKGSKGSPPTFSASPLAAWFDDSPGPSAREVPVWLGEGGHLLCQPTIGGHVLGLFIIDTGTSCLVIDPDVLPPELVAQCERFGYHTVQGLGGAELKTALCRGLGPLVLGPLMLERPLFREASLAGVVRGPGGPGPAPRIAGILGYDFLRHCRLEIGTPSPQSGGKLWMRVQRSGGVASPRVAVGWQRARFLGRVPHIKATVGAARPPLVPPAEAEVENRQEIEMLAAELRKRTEAATGVPLPRATSSNHMGLFRLGLGIGGTSLILASRLAGQLFSPNATFSLKPSGLVSGAASHDQPVARLQNLNDSVRTIRVEQVSFTGASFDNVRALCYLNGDPGDLELSCYADGVVGAPLFQGCCLVLDYANHRISVAQQQLEGL